MLTKLSQGRAHHVIWNNLGDISWYFLHNFSHDYLQPHIMTGNDIHLTDRVSGTEVIELDTISRKSVNITEEELREDVESRIENPPSGHRIRSIAQFAACCWLKMLSGWNDGTSGPLIPRLQEVYQVRPDCESTLCVRKPTSE